MSNGTETHAEASTDLPLAGVTVVDLAQFVSGSYCTQLLGDLGADVLKVELPGSGDPYRGQGPEFVDGVATLFLALNRNKRSVCIDWKLPEGRAVLERLIDRADVFVQNARPGVLERYGIDHAAVCARHPGLVYCAISGYGQTGPHADRGGFDLILQAEAGVMSVTGEVGRAPAKVGVPLLDIGAAISAVAGINAALVRRARTGDGAFVDSSLLDFSLALLATSAQSFFATGVEPIRMGSASAQFAPYQAFPVGTEYLVVAGAGNERLWRKLCEVIGRPDLPSDPRFRDNSSRVAHQEELAAIVADVLSSRSRDAWLAAFEAAGIPSGPINGLRAVFDSPQVRTRGNELRQRGDAAAARRFVAAPVRFGDHPLPARSAPPGLGEHTRSVLSWLGIAQSELDALFAAGVVA